MSNASAAAASARPGPRVAVATVSSVLVRREDATTLRLLERQNKLDVRAVVDFLAGLACAALEDRGAAPPDDAASYAAGTEETASVPITAGVRQRLERCAGRLGLSPGRILSMGLRGLRRGLGGIHLAGRDPFVAARNSARRAPGVAA